MESESARRYVPNVGFAIVHAALGERDEAFKWLEKDFDHRSLFPPSYAVEPVLDELRDDPRFEELVRRHESGDNGAFKNNCGPQYRTAAASQQPQRPRTLFESLFGGPLREEASPDADPLQLPQSGAFRTVCVRTCDGFFFPISYATTQAKFAGHGQRGD